METGKEKGKGKSGKLLRKEELTCYEIKPIDSIRQLNISNPSDDVILVADKGYVSSYSSSFGRIIIKDI